MPTRRSVYAAAILIVAAFDVAQAAAQEAAQEMIVRTGSAASPRDIVYLYAGTCGQDRYEAELRGSNRPASGSTLILRVNGRAVAPEELRKVAAQVTEGAFLYNAVVTECPLNARRARVRVMFAARRARGPSFLSFLISSDGEISDLRRH